MTLGQTQEIFSVNVGKLLLFADVNGFNPRLRECQRTIEQQEIYLKKGKSRTRYSAHLDSLAVDIYFTKNGKLLESKEDLQILGAYWESLHTKNEWGGNWTSFLDCPHFEMKFN